MGDTLMCTARVYDTKPTFICVGVFKNKAQINTYYTAKHNPILSVVNQSLKCDN